MILLKHCVIIQLYFCHNWFWFLFKLLTFLDTVSTASTTHTSVAIAILLAQDFVILALFSKAWTKFKLVFWGCFEGTPAEVPINTQWSQTLAAGALKGKCKHHDGVDIKNS